MPIGADSRRRPPGSVGHEVAETTDESPERVAVVQRLTTAWLRTALHVDGGSWAAARSASHDAADPIGHVDST